MGLRVYTAHLPPPSADDPTPVVIKEGFSWGAFIFGVIWALWYRLWIEAAALLALFLALGVIADFVSLSDGVESAVLLAVAVLIGFSGNDWRRESLRRRGFQEGGVASGPTSEDALRRFLDLRVAEAPKPAPTPASYQDPAALFPAPVAEPVPETPGPGGAAAGSIAGWYSSSYQPPRATDPTYPGDPQPENAPGYGYTDARPDDRPRG
jgi:hypothetical protein